MKLKALIMATAVASLGAVTIAPPPITAYEAEAKKKKKKKKKKRTGNRNRSTANAEARSSGRSRSNQRREAQRAQLNVPARDLMSRSAGDRRGIRGTRSVYPGARREASPTRTRRARRGSSTAMETSSVSSSSTISTVLTRQPMPEN